MADIKYEKQKLYIHLTEPGKGDTRKVFNSILDTKNYSNVESDDKIPVIIVVSMNANMEDLRDYITNFNNAHIIPDCEDGLDDTIEGIIYNEGFTKNNDNIIIKHCGGENFNYVDLCNILENIPFNDINIVGLYIDNLKSFDIDSRVLLPMHMDLNRKKLKKLAVELSIPIISNQQINRSAISGHNCHTIADMDISEKDDMKVIIL